MSSSHETVPEPEEPTVIHSLGSRKVTVHNNKAIKSGSSLYAHEASNLQYIAENTTIPVPRIHGIKRNESGAVQSISMDYIPGIPLDEAWPEMTEQEKGSVAQELRDYINQLRNLKSNDVYIGAANRGEAIIGDIVLHSGGPFDNESLFNELLFSKIVSIAPEALRHFATSTFRDDHNIVFTHGDLAPRNILVDGGRVMAILDWENAGWYPEYWEHVRAYREINALPGWSDYLSIILPLRYSAEVVAMSYLARISR